MSRIATTLSRGATPVDPRPGANKRPKPGDTLDGWLLEQLLGFGGWGQVFRARRDGDVRALKIMHAELSRNVEFVRRFKREMGMLMSLGTHPHLIRIDPDHLFGKADDWNCWYYVMEYVEGITLERYLSEKQRALTVDEARALLTGVAEGLASAHKRDIIHRDIKPANILIRHKLEAGQGQAILVDFGLAGLVDPNSRGAGYSALFAAPEQMRDGTSDSRSDIYSFAATIYYCLLYGDPAKRNKFKAKLLPADVSADIRDLLERCFDNDPEEHPCDAGAFVAEWKKPSDRHPPQQPPKTEPPPPPAPHRFPKTFTNSLGMQFALAPPGTFWMGERGSQRQIEVPHYLYMGIYPVTQREWQALMSSNPSWFSRSGWFSFSRGGGGTDKVRGISDADLKHFPVEQVSWKDAQEFIKKLNAQERDREWLYRLPGEVEWEYICRGGAVSQADYAFDFYFDQPTNDLSSRQANFDGNYPYGQGAKGPYLERTTKVGSYKPNRLGVYDMHGNVWEWCEDTQGASDRVLRGGSWLHDGGALPCGAP